MLPDSTLGAVSEPLNIQPKYPSALYYKLTLGLGSAVATAVSFLPPRKLVRNINPREASSRETHINKTNPPKKSERENKNQRTQFQSKRNTYTHQPTNKQKLVITISQNSMLESKDTEINERISESYISKEQRHHRRLK